MDLNLLLKHHQLALMGVRPGSLQAGKAQSGQLRLGAVWPEPAVSFDLVGHYARKIRRLRLELGAIHYPQWIKGDEPAGAGTPAARA